MATKKTAGEQGLQQKMKVLAKPENPRCDPAGYDGHHRASGAGCKEPPFLILGRWKR